MAGSVNKYNEMVNVDGVINAGYKNIAPSSLSLLILYKPSLYWHKYLLRPINDQILYSVKKFYLLHALYYSAFIWKLLHKLYNKD